MLSTFIKRAKSQRIVKFNYRTKTEIISFKYPYFAIHIDIIDIQSIELLTFVLVVNEQKVGKFICRGIIDVKWNQDQDQYKYELQMTRGCLNISFRSISN